MKKTWTIKRQDGTTKTLATWGYEDVVLTRRSLEADTLRFGCRTEDIDDLSNRLNDGETIRLYWQEINAAGKLVGDPVQYFVGRVDLTDPWCNQNEGVNYSISGPWWYIANLPYQQQWKVYLDGILTTLNKTRVRLCEDIASNKITIGVQIAAVLQWVKDAGAPFDFDADELINDFQYFTLVDEVVDMMSSECLTRLLRVIPDAVGRFDYSAETPVFQLKRYSQLPVETLTIGDAGEDDIIIVDCKLRPLTVARVPAVVIKYEQANQVADTIQGVLIQTTYPNLRGDGSPIDITTDAAEYAAKVSENEKQFGALVTTVNLEGSYSSYIAQPITTQPISEDILNTPEYWKARIPWLNDPKIDPASLTFKSGNALRQANDVNVVAFNPSFELTRGTIAGWMRLNNGAPVIAAEFMASVIVKYRVLATEVNNVRHYTDFEEKVLYWPFMGTNGISGTYVQQQLETIAEPVPFGLERIVFDALNILHFQGQILLDEEDCTGTYGLGQRLNVTGGDPAWATANACVQQVSERIDNGKTTIQVGPPPHLSVKDIIDWMRIWRVRKVRTNGSQRSSGQSALGGRVELGQQAPLNNAQHPIGQYRTLIIATAENQNQMINLNPAMMVSGSTIMEPRLVTMHIKEGSACVPYTAWMLMSVPQRA